MVTAFNQINELCQHKHGISCNDVILFYLSEKRVLASLHVYVNRVGWSGILWQSRLTENPKSSVTWFTIGRNCLSYVRLRNMTIYIFKIFFSSSLKFTWAINSHYGNFCLTVFFSFQILTVCSAMTAKIVETHLKKAGPSARWTVLDYAIK